MVLNKYSCSHHLLLVVTSVLISFSVQAQHTPAGWSLTRSPYWHWQNPTPMGYDLLDVVAPDDSTALVLDHYGVTRITSRGTIWQRVRLDTVDWKSPSLFVDDQGSWLSSPFQPQPPPVVHRTHDGGLTWAVQALPHLQPNMWILDVQYATPQIGYCVSRKYIPGGNPSSEFHVHRTSDSGQTWTDLSVLPGEPVRYSNWLYFPTPDTGYALCRKAGFPQQGSLLRTTDGGQSWADASPPGNNGMFYSASFLTGQQGWITTNDGQSGYVIATRDGGQSWDAPVAVTTAGWSNPGICFADPLHGVLITSSRELRYTTDGGVTWQASQGWPATRQVGTLSKALIRPGGVGWAAGVAGSVARTTDYGAHWTLVSSSLTGLDARITRLETPEPEVAWAFVPEGRLVLRTAAAADTWEKQELAFRAPAVSWASAELTTASFPDADTAYVAGVDSIPGSPRRAFLLRTTDAGLTWGRLPVPPAGGFTALRFRDGQNGVVIDTARRALRTTDGGHTWQVAPTGAGDVLWTLCWADDHTLFAAGGSGSFVTSVDGGLSWHRFAGADTLGIGPYTAVSAISFPTPRIGSVGIPNQISSTQNAGQSWSDYPLATPGIRWAYDFSFASPAWGWAVSDADLFATADSGRTWASDSSFHKPTAQAVTSHLWLLSAARADRYNGWVGGYYGTLARYSEKMIRTQPAARTAFAAGDSLSVPFTTTGTFTTAEQDFRVELSNSMGRFRNGQTLIIGQGTASPIPAVIPASVPAGSRYRIRVVRANGSVLGTASAQYLALSTPEVFPASAMSVFPNPARQLVEVRFAATLGAEAHLTLTDALGRVLKPAQVLPAGGAAVSLSGLAPGHYWLRLKLPDGRQGFRQLIVAQ